MKWPRANDAASYKQFDNEVFKIVSRCIGSTEQKLERLAEIVYEEGKKRFGLDEGKQKKVEGKKSRLSRRQEKIAALRREKKKLRASWNEALPEEREGLKALYEDVKKQHRQIMRSERRMQRKKERHRCRRNFVKNPYKFAKGIFIESKSGNLECTKEELENHLRCTYSDPTREVEMPEIHGTRRPAEPGIPFNLGDIKKKEVDDFVKKSGAKSAPGNDGVGYKVYKKCPRLRARLFMLIREMWRKKSVAERWCIAEGIYLPKRRMQKN